MNIKVDTREPENFRKQVEKYKDDNEVVFEQLPVGDALCNNIIIERKEMADFVNSIRSGHIYKQLWEMEQNYDKCYLLISGNYKELYFRGVQHWTVEHHVGSLVAITARFPKIRILQFETTGQLIQAMMKIFEKCSEEKATLPENTELMKNKLVKMVLTDEDLELKILTSFNGVGLKKGKKLQAIPEIKAMVNALISKVKEQHV